MLDSAKESGVGVQEVWIVDLDRRTIEVSSADGRRSIVQSHVVRWHAEAMATPLELDLEAVFRDIV